MIYERPFIILFPKIGNPAEGYISIGEEQKGVPFKVKRVFWTYFTPESIVRGKHAHHNTEMILIAAAGKIIVDTELPDGYKETFQLDQPEKGLYLPKYCWHTMQYSHSAIQIVLASSLYNKNDYIREYESFKQI